MGKREGGVGVSKAERCIHHRRQNAILLCSYPSLCARLRYSRSLHPAAFLSRFLGLALEENAKIILKKKRVNVPIDVKENELKIVIDIFPPCGKLSIDLIKHIF